MPETLDHKRKRLAQLEQELMSAEAHTIALRAERAKILFQIANHRDYTAPPPRYQPLGDFLKNVHNVPRGDKTRGRKEKPDRLNINFADYK